MSNLPVRKAKFDDMRKKITSPSLIHGIDALFEMQCELVVCAYHGGYVRAGIALACHGVKMGVFRAYFSAVYRLCDYVGWTQLRQIPDIPGAFTRHGGKCDKWNCDNIDCVQDGIPTWFKKVARIHEP